MKIIAFIAGIVFGTSFAFSQTLIANAGGDKHFCTYPDSLNQLIIGGSPTAIGGVEPYTYEWSIEPFPLYSGSNITIISSHLLDDTTQSNPNITDFTIRETLQFKLKVTDDIGQVAIDSCNISFSSFAKSLMNYSYVIPLGDSIFLEKGTNIGSLFDHEIISYQWSPTDGLSNSTLANNFWAAPTTETVYSVNITDSYGCEAQGDSFYFVKPITVGITETNDAASWEVFPNPARDKLYIKTHQSETFDEIKIFDFSGKLIKQESQNFGASAIDVSELAPGLYFLSIYTQGRKIFETKIIRN